MITVFIVSVSCFMKVGGQTSKNDPDIRKVCLETTMCVLACFVEFYVFIFDEIDRGDPKLVYEHILVGNVQEKVPRTIQGSIRKDIFLSQSCPRSTPIE